MDNFFRHRLRHAQNQLCACGHYQSDHRGFVNHEECGKPDCDCIRFTFACFVFKTADGKLEDEHGNPVLSKQ